MRLTLPQIEDDAQENQVNEDDLNIHSPGMDDIGSPASQGSQVKVGQSECYIWADVKYLTARIALEVGHDTARTLPRRFRRRAAVGHPRADKLQNICECRVDCRRTAYALTAWAEPHHRLSRLFK
jgi:hypothetical protein